MVKRMIVMLILVGIVFGGIFGYQAFMGGMMQKHMAGGGMPPTVVSAIKAEMQDWQPEINAVGSLKTVKGVDITTEVLGIVKEISFKSGDEVKEGQVLVQLNADPERAQLRSLKIDAELANTTLDRDKKQLEAQAVSQETVDIATADFNSKRAMVDEQEAVIAKKTIRAPFAGKLGITSLNLGQYVIPGERIVTLQSLDPIFCDFYLPQQYLPRIALGQKVDVTIDAYPDRIFTGKITAINPKVDVDSRNVLVEATLSNPDHKLLPGMFASVEVEAGKKVAYLTLPQTAVTFNPYGETIYVVEENGKGPDGKPHRLAKQRFVTVGETRGDQLSITSGVKEGELVVTSGQMKLQNNSPVVVDNSVQPSNDPAPAPVNK